jgi:hypothetical protein
MECQIISTSGPATSQPSADVECQIIFCNKDRQKYLPVVAPASSDSPSCPQKLIAVFSQSDLAALEAEFASNSKPSSLHIAQLALRLGQTDAHVKAWFEKKRQPSPSTTNVPATVASSTPNAELGVTVKDGRAKRRHQQIKLVSLEDDEPRERPKRNRPSIAYAGDTCNHQKPFARFRWVPK